MIYFANPTNRAATNRLVARGLLGYIDTPNQGNRLAPGVPWCADNGCFGKGFPGYQGWLKWLRRRSIAARSCWFVTMPDVVGDAEATLARGAPFMPQVRGMGFKVALVAQDGITKTDVPWDRFDVLFLGGSDEFKLGAEGEDACAEALQRGKTVHMGRVNSRIRMLRAQKMGCLSVDGTHLAFRPHQWAAQLEGWLDELNGVAS